MWAVSATLTEVVAALAAALPRSLVITVVLECTAGNGPEVRCLDGSLPVDRRHLRTTAVVLLKVAEE